MKKLGFCISLLATTALTNDAVAQVAATGDWEYVGNIYLWGSGLDASTPSGGEISLSFGDILDKLDFGIMGSFAARRGDLTLFFDGIYLDISNSTDVEFNPGPGPGVSGSVGLSAKAIVTTFGAGYNSRADDDMTLTWFGAARGLLLDSTITPEGGGPASPIDVSNDFWDGVIGVRGRNRLSEKWSLTYYADIGTGSSDLTYQGLVAFNYQLQSWDLSFGYRHMDWDLGNDQGLSGLTLSGPFIGAAYRF